ncbi:hypothetical protein TSUD_187540 [Trifolium subterraneum]|uniref:Uncharacterized protein n=1 Tax=Trifolium subterraneum TaxID=3900 RepID=A0A2Z6NVU4_TRISU|nr:hypothetical protein TSUD_187540 [Trifolium subterraneum]
MEPDRDRDPGGVTVVDLVKREVFEVDECDVRVCVIGEEDEESKTTSCWTEKQRDEWKLIRVTG